MVQAAMGWGEDGAGVAGEHAKPARSVAFGHQSLVTGGTVVVGLTAFEQDIDYVSSDDLGPV